MCFTDKVIFLHVQIPRISDAICWLSFCDALRTTLSRSIRVAADAVTLFFFTAEECSIVYTYHRFFIHSSLVAHSSCLHVLLTVNRAAMNIGGWVRVLFPKSNSVVFSIFTKL